MKLSPQTQQIYEEFFRYYFNDQGLSLPVSQIFLKRFSRLLTQLLGIEGITFGRFIFIRPELAKPFKDQSLSLNKTLLAHELTHVYQYRKMGFIKFLADYLKQYLRNLRQRKKINAQARLEAYWEISYEIEAREAARRFDRWFEEFARKKPQ